MNKQEVLEKILNEEDRFLISKIFDKIESSSKKNTIEYTSFLDMHQKAIVKKVLNQIKHKQNIFYGGFDNAEREVCIIYPEKLEAVFENNQFDFNNIISSINIKLPSDLRGKYAHPVYLGAVVKVGLNREKVGDILVSIDGADVIVLKETKNILINSFKELTRFSKSEMSMQNIEDINICTPKTEVFKIIIPSMRLDSIVSDLIRTSRGKANEYINSERVYINGEIVKKSSKAIKDNDLITVRGKGRFKINKIVGNTKKNNIVLEVEKYV